MTRSMPFSRHPTIIGLLLLMLLLVQQQLVSISNVELLSSSSSSSSSNHVASIFVNGFVPSPLINHHHQKQQHRRRQDDRHHDDQSQSSASIIILKKKSALFSMTPTPEKQQQQQESTASADLGDFVDPDAPEEAVGGAEFFGGNKQKEEYYDPVAEANVGLLERRRKKKKLSTLSTSDDDDEEDEEEYYHRFSDPNQIPSTAFDTCLVASIGQSVQRQISRILYNDNDDTVDDSFSSSNKLDLATTSSSRPLYSYAPNLQWETPFSKSTNDNGNKNSSPLEELRLSKEFYKKLDVAIVGGRQVSQSANTASTSISSVELFWEISVIWPTFWAPSVILSGSSTLDVQTDNGLIVRQVDRLKSSTSNDSSSLLSTLAQQIVPRFWDWYHIGMTPTAEIMPRIQNPTTTSTNSNAKRSLFANYDVYDVPGRLMTVPTLIETGTRDNRNAEVIPDHAFACYIKTMGPSKQDYVPTSPIEVRIGREQQQSQQQQQPGLPGSDQDDDALTSVNDSDNINQSIQKTTKTSSSGGGGGDRLQLSWSIPLSVEFQARNEILPIPGENPEADEGSDPQCSYRWEPPRRVATIAYGGRAQDVKITDIRKQLYDEVLKDGWKPKLDDSGRPQFFFWHNDVKACYTEEGLGMCVYEWRPEFSKSNEVGIELELDTDNAVPNR